MRRRVRSLPPGHGILAILWLPRLRGDRLEEDLESDAGLGPRHLTEAICATLHEYGKR